MIQTRSGILAYFCTRQHWLWITVKLHISGARLGEAVAREGGRYAPVRRVSGSEPLSLKTHRHRGWSRPLRSAVVEYQAPSIAVWLQLCARTGHASGYSRHTVMHVSPPAHRTHGHVSGPLAKFDMGHYFRRVPWPLSPIGYLDQKRDRAYNQRVSYSRSIM